MCQYKIGQVIRNRGSTIEIRKRIHIKSRGKKRKIAKYRSDRSTELESSNKIFNKFTQKEWLRKSKSQVGRRRSEDIVVFFKAVRPSKFRWGTQPWRHTTITSSEEQEARDHSGVSIHHSCGYPPMESIPPRGPQGFQFLN